jgi:TRAP-type transport system small permease protein
MCFPALYHMQSCYDKKKGVVLLPAIFVRLDRFKPFFDFISKIVLFLCKLLLVADVLITTMSVMGRYISFIPDPAWSEEMVLTCMAYMAVLSAAIALRNGTHIRMTALDRYLPKKLLYSLELLADAAVLFFALIMLTQGMKYSVGLGSKGFYTSIPTLSKFWAYFPIPLAGMSMILFEIEIIYNHIKAFFVKEEVAHEC